MREPEYQIIANSDASLSKINKLEKAARNSGIQGYCINTTGGKSGLGADAAPEVILLLKYVGLTVTGGFFAALGTDLWKKVKKFVVQVFESVKTAEPIYNPIIILDVNVDGATKLQVYFPRKGIKELKKSFDSLQVALNELNPVEFTSAQCIDGNWILGKELFQSQEAKHKELLDTFNNKGE